MPRAAKRSLPTRRTNPYVRFNPTSSKTNSKPKPRLRLDVTQKDIFDWYETNKYRDDAGEIFSTEWQCRLTRWGEEFDSSTSDIHNDIESLGRNPESLELGSFFQAHPIAAFSLWHVLQACYELDRVICGTTIQERVKIAEWQNWRPFQYLLSQDIISCWEEKLSLLSSQSSEVIIGKDKFKREDVARRLQRIAHAVHTLEEAILTLTSVFERRRQNMACTYWMLGKIQESVDNKSQLIENISAARQT